ncbi:vacuolar family H+-ATPase subunit H [Enterocloster sp.]|uniref:vacuolar family H+-ATPase subunit H n=1 Tax=Enterocloster sp. TaxID=2719315 RepID=UPI0030783003
MSRIEQLISEIEEYIDSCKSQALSKSKIIVNKEEMEELLVELRMRIPDEITKYQKIISQQQTILNDARSQSDAMLSEAKAQADVMIAQATEQANSMVSQASEEANSMVAQANEQTTEMINEHEIMQRAYSHAEEVISQANIQAQAIVDAAVNDANNIRQGSIQYTDDMLRSLQTILNHTMDNAKGRFDAFMSSMQSSYDIVSANRNELSGGIVKEENAEAAAAVENQETQAD